MLSSKTVVLDVEGFRHKKENFIVKELGVCTEVHLDCVLLLPLGIEWDTENYLYNYLTQII